jgi:hypothetical protein
LFTHSISAKPQQWPKNRRLSPLLTNFSKNRCHFIAGDLKTFLKHFCFDFLHMDHSNDFCFCKFFAKGLRTEGERLKVKFWSSEMVKIGRGQHNYHRCRHPPPPSEFCNDENNSVIRSAMDALRNSKKISLLAVAILFLFTFFYLILDAPRIRISFFQNIFPYLSF